MIDVYAPASRYLLLEGLELAIECIADGKFEHATRIVTALHHRLLMDAAMEEKEAMVDYYGPEMLNQ